MRPHFTTHWTSRFVPGRPRNRGPLEFVACGRKKILPIRHVFANTANTKGATRVTPLVFCLGSPVGITLKFRVEGGRHRSVSARAASRSASDRRHPPRLAGCAPRGRRAAWSHRRPCRRHPRTPGRSGDRGPRPLRWSASQPPRRGGCPSTPPPTRAPPPPTPPPPPRLPPSHRPTAA